MASLKIVNIRGEEQGHVEASDTVFNAEANETLVHDVVVALQANRRQGTHKTKTRKDVSGGGAKPFRQKGTGRARQGSSREPQMRGGGTVHGPVPRNYRHDVSKQVRRQALCCALSARARNERLSVLKGMNFEGIKTKPVAEMLDQVSREGRKTLLVTADYDHAFLLSARNIARMTVRTAAEVNTLDVLAAVRVVVQEEALAKLEERLA
ncbi:MAG: 50S ribosomal protein L4 [Candidatus Hydrogenedentes bacterium]|nr:50S ribosomal protein L4 [Candidatus Hydrogenedentota bacterium]